MTDSINPSANRFFSWPLRISCRC